MRQSTKPRPGGWFLSHLIEVLTLLYTLFLLQLTLVPFDFSGMKGLESSGRLFAETFDDISTPNLVANITLFVVFGLLVHWCMMRRRLGVPFSAAITVGLAAALSLIVEWFQSYSAQRVSSAIDFACNIFGGSIGVIFSTVYRFTLPRWLGRLVSTFEQRPRVALTQCYVFLLLVFAASPFTYSVDLNWAKHCQEIATVVPFAEDTALSREAEAAMRSGNHYDYVLTAYTRQRLWSSWLAEAASFVVLAWGLYTLFRDDYLFSRWSCVSLVFWLGIPLAVILSGIQLFNVVRGFHSTDILFRVFGLTLGVVLRYVYGLVRSDQPKENALHYRWVARVGCAAVFLFIVFNGLLPWLPTNVQSFRDWGKGETEWLPFYAYFNGRFHLMLADMLSKGVSFAILGSLAIFAMPGLACKPLRGRIGLLALAGMCIAIPMEIIQYYKPVRVTSLTDVILAGIGAGTGVALQHHLVIFYQFATEHYQRHCRRRKKIVRPVDELMSSLLDSDLEAPVEEMPRATSVRRHHFSP